MKQVQDHITSVCLFGSKKQNRRNRSLSKHMFRAAASFSSARSEECIGLCVCVCVCVCAAAVSRLSEAVAQTETNASPVGCQHLVTNDAAALSSAN